MYLELGQVIERACRTGGGGTIETFRLTMHKSRRLLARALLIAEHD
jgi:hypothetical protein